MNLLLLDRQQVSENSAIMTGRQALHIIKTLRSKPGDRVRVGIIDGLLGSGLIHDLAPGRVEIEIDATNLPPPKIPIGLILALPRPIMLRRVLAQAASLGVARIFLINANRVEKSFFNASQMAEEKLREALLLGLEQAMDTVLPEISIHQRFRPFVEDHLPEVAVSCPVRLVAHPDGEMDLAQTTFSKQTDPALVAIGPEGGWIDFEIELLRQQGFKAFSLGSRILRVDTAVPAIIAQLDLLRSLATG
jgi:16S rRNA (uracil1498-N3)-methyltransferase